MHRLLISVLACAPVLSAGDAAVRSALAKLHMIENGAAKRGSVIFFSLQEINSWAYYMVPGIVPEGIRNQKVTLGTDSGSAYALMDFLRMRHAQGKATNWMMSKLIEGERPVTIAIHLESSGRLLQSRSHQGGNFRRDRYRYRARFHDQDVFPAPISNGAYRREIRNRL